MNKESSLCDPSQDTGKKGANPASRMNFLYSVSVNRILVGCSVFLVMERCGNGKAEVPER